MKLGGWLTMLTILCIFLTLVGVETSLSVLFTKLGITVNPETSTFTSNPENASFWSWIFSPGTGLLILIGSVGSSIIVGLFGKGYDPSLVLAPFVVLVGGLFISCFVSIMSLKALTDYYWMKAIIGLLFSGLAVGFMMSCVDYFGGR